MQTWKKTQTCKPSFKSVYIFHFAYYFCCKSQKKASVSKISKLFMIDFYVFMT